MSTFRHTNWEINVKENGWILYCSFPQKKRLNGFSLSHLGFKLYVPVKDFDLSLPTNVDHLISAIKPFLKLQRFYLPYVLLWQIWAWFVDTSLTWMLIATNCWFENRLSMEAEFCWSEERKSVLQWRRIKAGATRNSDNG